MTIISAVYNLLTNSLLLEHNRNALIGSPECMQLLLKLLSDHTPPQQDTDIEDFVIKVLFNLCNDSRLSFLFDTVPPLTPMQQTSRDRPLCNMST